MLRVGAGRRTIVNRGMADLAFIGGLSPAAWFRYNIGITIAGSGVSVWADQSGNGRDLKQGTDTNRPALQADGSILFDGVDNFLKCDAFTLNQPETVYILFKQVTWSASDTVFDGQASRSLRLTQLSGTPGLTIDAGTTGTINNDLALDTYGAVASVFNGASSVIQVNNNAPTTGFNVGAANAGGFTMGAAGAATNFANIQAKEVILFAAAHDAATRARVIRYLAMVGQVPI